jgi:hypothetical protein
MYAHIDTMVQDNKEIKTINIPPRKLTLTQMIELITQTDNTPLHILQQTLVEMRKTLKLPPLPKGRPTPKLLTSKHFQDYCTWWNKNKLNKHTEN